MISEIVDKIIQQQLKENERKIFEEKVADGTLDVVKELNKLLDKQRQVLFCNATTRDLILRDMGEIPQARFVVSNVIEDNMVYMIPDPKITEEILLKIE